MRTLAFTTLASLLAFSFAGVASADSECGVLGIGGSYTCGGDSGSDPYAGCDGVWRDVGSGVAGAYAQACVNDDDGPHVWICPAFTYDWSVHNEHCIASDHPFSAHGPIQRTVEDAVDLAISLIFDTGDMVVAILLETLA